jgi:serine/threonine-protein kinase
MRFCQTCRASFQVLRTCPRDGTPTRADCEDPLLGHTLGGRYRVLDRIGSGGMGQVYRAAHVRIASLFAIKVLYGDVAHEPDMRARFQREAEAASCLSSPHIVRVIDFGESPEDLGYLVMELLDGPSLSTLLSREGRLSEARALAIGRDLARGLAHAHRRGIVHRDLKPDNVLLVDDEEDGNTAKLLDFGLAHVRTDSRLTRAGQVFGTPHYMAPEQFIGASVDARTDLYAMGAILFEMVTGGPPFDANTVAGLQQAHFNAPPPPIRERLPPGEVSPAFEALVARLLAKAPDDRLPSARAVLDAIRSIAAAKDGDRETQAPRTRSGRALPDGVREQVEAAIRDGSTRYNTGDALGCARIYGALAEELAAAPGLPIAARARLRCALERAARLATAAEAAWEIRYAFDDVLHAASAPHPASNGGTRAAVEIALAEVVSAPRQAAQQTSLLAAYYVDFTRALAAALRAEGAAYQADVLDRVAATATGLPAERALAYVRGALDRVRAGEEPTSSAFPLVPAAQLEDCPGLEAIAKRITEALRIGVPAYNSGDVRRCRDTYAQAADEIATRASGAPACAAVVARLRGALGDASTLPESQGAWALRHAFDDLLAAAAAAAASRKRTR